MLAFPLWTLDPLTASQDARGVNAQGYRYAFTSAQGATDFLMNQKSPGLFSIRLISRSDAVQLAAELAKAGIPGLCVNPLRDTGLGHAISNAQLAAAIGG